MKCSNCGYELARPNIKTCPLCGHRITPVETVETEEKDSPLQSPLEESANPGETVVAEPENNDIDLPSDEKISVNQDFATADNGHTNFHDSYSHETMESHDELPDISGESNNVQTVYERSDNASPSIEPSVVPPVYNKPRSSARAENPEEYLDNGSYQPYPEDIDESGNYENRSMESSGSQASAWAVTALAAIAGLLLGAVLFIAVR